MPGPTQNSDPVSNERLLKELGLLHQRLGALNQRLIAIEQKIPSITAPRIVHASEFAKSPQAHKGKANGAKAHE